MSGHRKLGFKTSHRLSVLRNLTTQLIVAGHVETTVTRAKEVQKIAEQLITDAVREHDNFTTKEILTSKAKLDAKGKKVLKEETSKAGNTFYKVDRELKTEDVQVDDPSRLQARRKAMQWLVKTKDENGQVINPTNVLFNDVAPRYVDRKGGYTRIIPLETRRGDAALKCRLELI